METGGLTGHMRKLLPVLLSFLLYCCIKHYPKAAWEKEVFTWLIGYGELSREAKAGTQSRNSEAGTEVEMSGVCCVLASLRSMLGLLSYTV